MNLHGKNRIGATLAAECPDRFAAVDPRTGDAIDGRFAEATAVEVGRALEMADRAGPVMRALSGERKAELLESIATRIEELGDALLERASAESGLPVARFQGERGRTCGQLRMFAGLLREGSWVDARIDVADPARKPLPKPDTRRMSRALGPVAIFGASNFPLAFSVAGGDTASALAAGCPVVVKAHPKHPGTSELVGEAIHGAVDAMGLPQGCFSLVQGEGIEVGLALVRDPRTRAVGFTGSLGGGRALFDAAAARPEPIPVYAEMGSINPSVFLPAALAANAEGLAKGLAGSVTLGVGQFCTNPGLVIVQNSSDAERFVEVLAEKLASAAAHTMLHDGIRAAYDDGVGKHGSVDGVEVLARGLEGETKCAGRTALFRCTGSLFLREARLHEEVFGPSTLVVVCEDRAEILQVLSRVEGQLTGSIFGASLDDADLVAVLEEKVGRLCFDSFPTGVEVCASMQHGGPYPATTDARTTSVGTAAIERFVRPVCFQDCPASLLPAELRDENPLGIHRLVDGRYTSEAI